MKEHPAPFHPAVVAQIGKLLEARLPRSARLLDPFAGVGGVHALQVHGYRTIGVELEPEWAEQHSDTVVGNALRMHWRRGTFNAIVTSPCYGNRIADHHDAKDASKRHTYKHALGRDPSEDSAAILQWGQAYQGFHVRAISEATRVCKKQALFVLNMSDHFRVGRMQPVTGWWIQALTACGWEWVAAEPVRTQRLRHGANSRLRPQYEWVLVFERITDDRLALVG